MREHRMGVGIDEAGKHHASATVDLDNLLAILLQPRIAKSVFCGANRDDLSGEAEHGSVLNDSHGDVCISWCHPRSLLGRRSSVLL